MQKLPISLIVLTHNEEVNIEKCLESVKNWVSDIFIVDSHSTDGTAGIAKRYGAKVVEHDFVNQAQQFNWALDTLNIKSEWILRLDADEEMTTQLWQEISEVFSKKNYEIRKKYESTKLRNDNNDNDEITGFYMKRRVYFMGRWIRHGGYYPTWILRLFRNGKGKSEDREMDEHIILLEGRAEKLENDFIDRNNKDLTFWIDKHNGFATREAREALKLISGRQEFDHGLGEEVRQKKLTKEKYYRQPMFLRVFIYFFYRYVVKLGFLDGVEGFIFHILQGFWYRFLVDSKLYELEKKSTKNNF